MATYFLCGIGGSGMSAIAQVLRARGHHVAGSDRSRDQGLNSALYRALSAQGIVLHPQDGSGVTPGVDAVVVSSAVEATIPDVKAALALGIPIRRRAEVLADLAHEGHSIAVGGTSGKTTVTGMIGHLLRETGRDPTVIAGGAMLNSPAAAGLGNAVVGAGGTTVVETDESDGSIDLFRPDVAVLTNITLDHRPMAELRHMFAAFCGRAATVAAVNADCAESLSASTAASSRITFGICATADVAGRELRHLEDGISFRVDGVPFRLQVPGTHNVSNALAAVAACRAEGVTTKEASGALASFRGIARRLQVLGRAGGVVVIDDFGHNPDKVSASLSALKAHPGRLIVLFQPHGYGPTRMLREGLVEAFVSGLVEEDLLMMPEIYYAGGTAQKDISSRDLVEDIAARGRRARYFVLRKDAGDAILSEAVAGDRVVVMGARDDSLTDFGKGLLGALGRTPESSCRMANGG